ncbi:MAG: hypothetical protein M3081_03935 [Gemmatimonadota bacterium]|nr:hypothetical protein [Gemmatimonadota bacterium]
MLARRLGFGLLFGIIGFLIAAIASYFLVQRFSSNAHDRSLEASMTSVFFFGPIGRLIGLIAGIVRGGR